ncbi:kinase-like domain-containing protein [Dunaliella salina]|uniref:Kinase-like domain-containing protein n=1 Tax=Dunaliella salina TaxID=3046 RepID=A0ABQ7FY69_DUNSA|nr:kinase-like domain-containing protein [Dunaliella salina]|eukprot:KAF5827310.1 kinase-like domain-containing protein [Dunaliella salina]
MFAGRCGSLLYMSPEVARGKPYNEKADVFSFAILAWELLGRSLLSAGLPSGDADAMLGYVAKVAWQGWRPALPFYWPTELKLLVSLCWHEEPRLRPSFATIFAKLQAMQQSGDVAQLVAAEAPLLLSGSGRHPASRQHQGGTSSSTAMRQREGGTHVAHGRHHHPQQQQHTAQDAKKNFLWKLLPEKMRQGTQQHGLQQQQQQQQRHVTNQHARKHHHVQQEVKQQLVEHLKQTKAMMLEQLSSKSPQHQKDF